jgi:hypothetical protein
MAQLLSAVAASCALMAAFGAGTAAGLARPGVPAAAAVLIAPDAVHAAGPSGMPPTTSDCERRYRIACYSPIQVQRAYQVPGLLRRGINGKGQTIVIVDSFGSPTVRRDLQVFDTAFHLPPPPALTVIQPAGRVPP